MKLIIYRHAEPAISADEKISGRDFPLWVQRYNESSIIPDNVSRQKEKIVYTSNLRRSIDTGYLIGEKINVTSLLREAEIPMIRFPSINMKADLWVFTARLFWLSGFNSSCESFSDAKKRAKQLVNMFKTIGLNEQKVIAVGHGFINRLIKKELLRCGWMLIESSGNQSFLDRMVFETHD